MIYKSLLINAGLDGYLFIYLLFFFLSSTPDFFFKLKHLSLLPRRKLIRMLAEC